MSALTGAPGAGLRCMVGRVLNALAQERREKAEKLLRAGRALELAAEALSESDPAPGVALLALYCELPTAAAAAAKANALGLRMPGRNGPRMCQPTDVVAALRSPPPDVLPGLLNEALDRYRRNGGNLDRCSHRVAIENAAGGQRHAYLA